MLAGSQLRSCVKVEMDVLVPVPNKPTVSVDVKQKHFNNNLLADRNQEL